MNDNTKIFAKKLGLDIRILELETRNHPDLDAREYIFTYGKYRISRYVSLMMLQHAVDSQGLVDLELEHALIQLNKGIGSIHS